MFECKSVCLLLAEYTTVELCMCTFLLATKGVHIKMSSYEITPTALSGIKWSL